MAAQAERRLAGVAGHGRRCVQHSADEAVCIIHHLGVLHHPGKGPARGAGCTQQRGGARAGGRARARQRGSYGASKHGSRGGQAPGAGRCLGWQAGTQAADGCAGRRLALHTLPTICRAEAITVASSATQYSSAWGQPTLLCCCPYLGGRRKATTGSGLPARASGGAGAGAQDLVAARRGPASSARQGQDSRAGLCPPGRSATTCKFHAPAQLARPGHSEPVLKCSSARYSSCRPRSCVCRPARRQCGFGTLAGSARRQSTGRERTIAPAPSHRAAEPKTGCMRTQGQATMGCRTMPRAPSGCLVCPVPPPQHNTHMLTPDLTHLLLCQYPLRPQPLQPRLQRGQGHAGLPLQQLQQVGQRGIGGQVQRQVRGDLPTGRPGGVGADR